MIELVVGKRADGVLKRLAINGRDPTIVSNWIVGHVLHLCEGDIRNSLKVEFEECIGQVIDLVQDGTITELSGKQILTLIHQGDDRPLDQLVDQFGSLLHRETSEIEDIIEQLLVNYPKEAQKLRRGKTGVAGFFVGLLIKDFKVDPKTANRIVKEKLL